MVWIVKLLICKGLVEHVLDDMKIDPSRGRFFVAVFAVFFSGKK
jgi:hypothetical protein